MITTNQNPKYAWLSQLTISLRFFQITLIDSMNTHVQPTSFKYGSIGEDHPLSLKKKFNDVLLSTNSRRPYVGHDNLKVELRAFSLYKVLMTFYIHENYREDVDQKSGYIHPNVLYYCFTVSKSLEKNNRLNKSWKLRLPKRLKNTIVCLILLCCIHKIFNSNLTYFICMLAHSVVGVQRFP